MRKVSKQILTFTLIIVMLFTSVPFIEADLKVSAIDSRVEQAVQTAIAIANDNSHGYSQSSRQGPDYDCSSLVYYAFSSAGFSLSPTWFYTRNMGSALTSAGFTELTNINLSDSSSLQRGDILWKEGHTEIYIGNNQLVGAHSDRGYPQTGDQPGNEISVENYYYKGSNDTVWTKVYRYGVADTSKPTISNVYTSNVSGSSFTINCTLNDNVAMSRVWLNIYANTDTGYHEDGYSVSASNGEFSHTINTSKYGGAGRYTVHMYAIDTSENSTRYAIDSILVETDNEKPQVSNVHISNISDSSFTINCTLNDNVAMSRVWLNIYANTDTGYHEDGYSVSASNGEFSHTINTSKYGGAGRYTVHMYAIDTSENSTRYAIDPILAYNSYIITYNPNGGENAPESQLQKYNEVITLSTVEPTREGYKFLGWATIDNATTPVLLPGDTYGPNKDITLYAVWEEETDVFLEIEGEIETFGEATDDVLFEFFKPGETDSCGYTIIEGDSETFCISGIKSDEYIIKISKENHVTREYSVTIGEEDVELDVQLNLIGDINGDGKVNTLDTARANSHAKGVTALSDYDFACADTNGDGKVNTLDVARMNAHAKGVTVLW